MSRLLKFVAFAVAALSVVALLPQAAWAVEGMGAHKGSFIFFPYWNNQGANRTFFRIAMDNELNDATPLGSLWLHFFFLARNPGATTINQEIQACNEFDRPWPFTRNDWELINTESFNQGFAGGDGQMGWAFAYAVLQRPDQPDVKVLWDRFFSDTFLVDVTLGLLTGWNNSQEWGNNETNADIYYDIIVDRNGNGTCDYWRDIQNDEFGMPINDLCQLGIDDGTAVLGSINVGGNYFGTEFPDTFYMHYFNGRNISGVGRLTQTYFSITPIHVDDTQDGPFEDFEDLTYLFNLNDDTDDLSYQYDVEVYDPNENAFSAPGGFVICHRYISLRNLTNQVTDGKRAGHLTMWEIDNVFGFGTASEDAMVLTIDSADQNADGVTDAIFAVYPAHNRTTAPLALVDILSGGGVWTIWDDELGDAD